MFFTPDKEKYTRQPNDKIERYSQCNAAKEDMTKLN